MSLGGKKTRTQNQKVRIAVAARHQYVSMSEMNTEGDKMIVRMWHGRVPTSKAQAYRAFLNERAIPDYQSFVGNISVYIVERKEGEVTHFITRDGI